MGEKLGLLMIRLTSCNWLGVGVESKLTTAVQAARQMFVWLYPESITSGPTLWGYWKQACSQSSKWQPFKYLKLAIISPLKSSSLQDNIPSTQSFLLGRGFHNFYHPGCSYLDIWGNEGNQVYVFVLWTFCLNVVLMWAPLVLLGGGGWENVLLSFNGWLPIGFAHTYFLCLHFSLLFSDDPDCAVSNSNCSNHLFLWKTLQGLTRVGLPCWMNITRGIKLCDLSEQQWSHCINVWNKTAGLHCACRTAQHLRLGWNGKEKHYFFFCKKKKLKLWDSHS